MDFNICFKLFDFRFDLTMTFNAYSKETIYEFYERISFIILYTYGFF